METLHKALEYYFGIGIEAFTGRLTIEKNDKGEAVKRPFLPKWKDAQFTLESALDLLSANDNCVCLKTGRKSGLWVLDIDNHGAAGVDTLREIGVDIDGAPCEKTQSGGTHVFYAFPADFVGSGTTAKPAAGLDARGEGGLIFAAPTKVNGGGEYAIVKPILRDRSNLSEPPKALLDFLFPPKQTTAPVPAAPRARRTGPLTPKQHAWWESALRECAAETEDRSKADFALLCTAVKLGMHPENVFRDCATIGKFRERGRLYFDTTWGRAAAAVPPSAPKRSAGPTRPQIVASATSADVQSIRSELWEISQTEGMTGTEKNRASAVAVVKWLHTRGRFYHTKDQTFAGTMFFDSQRKLLLPIQGDAFRSWLSDALAVNRSERPFDFVNSACETEGLSVRSTEIVPSAYWAAGDKGIYLSSGPGGMVRVSEAGVHGVDNGTDEILFPIGATLMPWSITEPNDPFESCSLFRDISTAAPHGRDLFRLWAMSLPSDQRTKPPLCLSGGVGSGKTRLIRGVFELYGLPARIGAVTKNGEMDFWAAIDGGGLTCFDNADTRTDWFADALAAAATAGTLEKRKLYTDAARISLKARAWLCVTSANPSFASDAGLADRLLVVRLNRRIGTTAETTLSDEIAAHRDAGLSWIAHKLSAALGDREPVPDCLNARHPDFASLAVRVGRAMGRGEEAIAALRAAEIDKSLFNIENDSVGSVLLQIMQMEAFCGTAAELLPRIVEVDATLAGRVSTKSLSKRLVKLWPHLESTFKATVDTIHGGVWRYTFQKR